MRVILLELCTHHELIVSDYEYIGRRSSQFTFVSDAHSTTSWLDHIICSFNLFCILSDICILDKLPSSDHLPIACNVGFDLQSTLGSCHSMDTEVKVSTVKFHWSKASDVEIEQYRMNSYTNLGSIIIPEAVKCTDNHCNCHEHQKQLDS